MGNTNTHFHPTALSISPPLPPNINPNAPSSASNSPPPSPSASPTSRLPTSALEILKESSHSKQENKSSSDTIKPQENNIMSNHTSNSNSPLHPPPSHSSSTFPSSPSPPPPPSPPLSPFPVSQNIGDEIIVSYIRRAHYFHKLFLSQPEVGVQCQLDITDKSKRIKGTHIKRFLVLDTVKHAMDDNYNETNNNNKKNNNDDNSDNDIPSPRIPIDENLNSPISDCFLPNDWNDLELSTSRKLKINFLKDSEDILECSRNAGQTGMKIGFAYTAVLGFFHYRRGTSKLMTIGTTVPVGLFLGILAAYNDYRLCLKTWMGNSEGIVATDMRKRVKRVDPKHEIVQMYEKSTKESRIEALKKYKLLDE